MAKPNNTAKTPAQSSGRMGLIVALLLATLIAAAAGALFGLQLTSSVKKITETRSAAEAKAKTTEKHNYSDATSVRPLGPIFTNLAAPPKTWIRLEAALVLTSTPGKDDARLIAESKEDIVAFLRTLSLDQIEGPSGFQHLRQDLKERVAIRSQGKFNDLVIQSLIVE